MAAPVRQTGSRSPTAAGSGDTALLFIHGGLADRTFWAPQFKALADRFHLVALDLGGHGESGRTRRAWTIRAFGDDARAVADALKLDRVVIVGNSLGGAVALEAARLLRGRAIAVIGVDTLHDLTQRFPPEDARARAEAFRKDFPGACRAMVNQLFHPNTYPDLRAWAEQRMLTMSPDVVVRIMDGFAGYDLAPASKNAGVPIRAINGDLWPTATEKNRTVVSDFDAVIMQGAGHYPMLEAPGEFSGHLGKVVTALRSSR